ncbi:MAG TPA: leucine--tRNA ligase [Bdellovibrionales bacterium]|nr:leucine--tRNA ligase [Bdellovibrionales bacterium]
MSYPHNEIDRKWQQAWDQAQCFRASEDASKPKYYALDMFPYPSGAGLHVGHLASYTPTDVVARYKRARGFQVLHPMGYDAFGLPAEQYAIQTGIHPAETTKEAIVNFRRQLKSFGYSFDWEREISTCEPDYYKWTQFIFLKLFEKGLAYQKEVPVNWCPALRTVLANEEVVDGKSERGGHPVIRKPMKQWMLKITDYAERLLEGLDRIDWPERTKEGQRHWIGKSEGARVEFPVEDGKGKLEVFTTRPDTLFGVTFMVIAPEHPLVRSLTASVEKAKVEEYVERSARRSELDRKADAVKTGVFTGSYALNPLMDAKDPAARVPIWIADYVLMDYGTGAIMAVPGHDARDFDFATKFRLPIQRVLESETELPFEGDGKLVNSEFLNGLSKPEAIKKILSEIEARKLGERQVQFKLRDWLFSRQRYWGEPFPIVHMEKSGTRGLAPDELPVPPPPGADYEPPEQGEPPLARVREFVDYTDKKTGEKGRRDTDTMPGSAGSSWYFLRYAGPKNSKEPFSFAKQKYWMPVDLYVGGSEHTVGHLLYARFWQKVLFDAGLVSRDEPIQKLAHQGVIMGPDGQRMSKSRGNVVNPDEVREQYGADATRMYISFLGPFDKDKPWATTGIDGVRRFLDRVWRLVVSDEGQTLELDAGAVPEALNKLLQKTIKKVGEDYDSMSFNTAISAMMILVNEMYGQNVRSRPAMLALAQLLAPLAPHLAEELWSRLGGQGLVSVAAWPSFDPALVTDDVITMGVQVNGKTRGTCELAPDASEEDAMNAARALNAVKNALDGKTVAKIIYKPGKILNIIVK